MTAAPLLLVGAGGLAREALAAVAAVNAVEPRWSVLGLLDDNEARHGEVIDGVPVLGPSAAVADHPDARVLLCTASTRNQASRRQIAARLGLPAERYATVVHPWASVAPGVEIGAGSVLLAFVAVTAPQVIGSHVVVMPHVTITHDDAVADHVTFAARVALAGGVTVGEAAYLGSGALVREGLTVGAGALVGMGAVVLADVPPFEVWAGSPARRLRALDQTTPGQTKPSETSAAGEAISRG
ncbi:NeuD/PglB/VioB family sugar acetyltransferase [Saccharothrix sp. 6-C]|uniref:NeuD/PglB/VioB family sugar acetyltransferase n=1 Tax=Saccharothrix sp. 6-C TaxID=2781735 RepID=UPI0019170F69|nr:NeuD/PglB/VioB family sugar acetyltransferase [Saccharothrix sp. 6-C]QQQ76586.1 NeuD/PglB/VioB family sugar acetyltransferase [Saccharothrix sp. 6-C]